MRIFIQSVMVALFLTPLSAQVAINQDGTRATKIVRTLKEMRDDQVVRQKWDMTCGAAAISTLLTYDFKDITPETAVVTWLLRRTDPVKVQARKGFSLLDLKRFVLARGYRAEGFSDMSLEELADLKVPAIVPIRSKGVDHFVVVRGVFGDRVVLADPAFGNMTIKARKFQEIWKQGIAFIVDPPDPGMFQRNEQCAGRPLQSHSTGRQHGGPLFTTNRAQHPSYQSLIKRKDWKETAMLWRRLIACSFLFAVSLAAQASTGAEASAKDRTEARLQLLQQALRERDAIIRNLLERVSELERKTNISPAVDGESAHSLNATLPNNLSQQHRRILKPDEQGYNEEDRKARAALDRALIQRGGLLLPSGTLELKLAPPITMLPPMRSVLKVSASCLSWLSATLSPTAFADK